MNDTLGLDKRFALAALLGFIGGGLAVAIATRAVPRMASGIMRSLLHEMGQSGCEPAELSQRMVGGFGEAR